MNLPPLLKHFLAPDQRTIFFAVKGVVAVSLALVTAISFDLDKPFWAVVAAMMLQARPETGLVVEKAGFLVLGSIAGALLALLILDNFIPYPLAALTCLALLIGATAMMSATVRHVNFVYAFALVSVTATMIVLFSMGDTSTVSSLNIFNIVRARISEAAVGATSAVLASLVLFPLRVENVLKAHAQGVMNAAFSHLAVLLDGTAPAQQLRKQRQSVIAAATMVSDDSNAGRYEVTRNINASLFIANSAISLVAATQALEQFVQDHPDAIDTDVSSLLEEMNASFKLLVVQRGEAQARLVQFCTRIRDRQAADDITPLQVSMLQIATELVDTLQNMLIAHTCVVTDVSFPKGAERFRSHRDPLIGGIAALRSMGVFAFCAGLWIVTGGSVVLVMMMVVPVLFSQMFSGAPIARLLVRKIAFGSLAAIPMAIVLGLGPLAIGVGSLEVLLLVFCAPLFVALMGMTNKDSMPYSLGFCICFAVLIQPSNYMSFSVDQSVTIGLGILMGLLVLFFAFDLVGHPSGVYLQRRIIKAIARDLSRVGDKPYRRDWFNQHMAERLLYLGGRETANHYSAQMTAQGLLGLDLGHAVLLVCQQLETCTDPGLKSVLAQWRAALAMAFLTRARSVCAGQFEDASIRLVESYRQHEPGPRRLALLQGTVERIHSSLQHLGRVNQHSNKQGRESAITATA